MQEIQDKTEDFRSLSGPIAEKDAGKRLDRYLADTHPFLSRSKWRERVLTGGLRVGGRRVRPSYRVLAHDQLSMRHIAMEEPPVDKGIYPVWKSGGVIVFFKPSHLPMHESGPYRENTFSYLLAKNFGKEWSAVHRLDRETSGLVMCASTPFLRAQLAGDLAGGKVEKEYFAFASGSKKEDFFVERGPIGDLVDSTIRIKKWVVKDGLWAETWFDVLERKKDKIYLRARPKTGRTNQIRIHAAFNGLPLVGDKLYHPDEAIFEEYFQNRGNTDHVIEKTGFHRLCLHAARLVFRHPETKKVCEVFSPLPEDMVDYWQRLDS